MRLHETVRAVMTPDPATVAPDTEFKDIAALLAARGISAVPVVDESGTPVGVVSEADLLTKAEYQDQDEPGYFAGPKRRHEWAKAQSLTAAEIMTPRTVTISPDASLPEAARVLAKAGVRRLLVVDDHNHLLGIVARHDLLKPFLLKDEQILADVRQQVLTRALWLRPGEVAVTVDNGVVTLTGTVERRTEAEIATRLTRALPGVVAVEDRLDYEWDDTGAKLDTTNVLH